MAKLSEDISEVHSIMTRNIADVLGQGERLDSESLHSHRAIVLSAVRCSVLAMSQPP